MNKDFLLLMLLGIDFFCAFILCISLRHGSESAKLASLLILFVTTFCILVLLTNYLHM